MMKFRVSKMSDDEFIGLLKELLGQQRLCLWSGIFGMIAMLAIFVLAPDDRKTSVLAMTLLWLIPLLQWRYMGYLREYLHRSERAGESAAFVLRAIRACGFSSGSLKLTLPELENYLSRQGPGAMLALKHGRRG